MFAEEIGGSAARKRQEQARARRRQLKQKQEQQAKKPVAAASVTKSSPGAATLTTVTPGCASHLGANDASKSVLLSDGGGAESSQPSAVALALQERKKRNQQKLQVSSAVRIQSCYRAYRCLVKLRLNELDLFDKRMSDLLTLKNILKQAGKGDYVPPPATASAMVTQILFLVRRTPWNRKGGVTAGESYLFILTKENGERIASLIEFVLIPGILSESNDLDPIIPWIQSASGKLRLEQLLCLVLEYWKAPQAVTVDETAVVIDQFLRAVMRVGVDLEKDLARSDARKPVIKYCRRRLLKEQSCNGDVLDLLQATRTLILYGVGGSPIPPDAEKLRENCISSLDKARADISFTFVMEVALSADDRLKSRIFSLFLTIPLLTWKISPSLVSSFTTGTDKHPSPFIVFLRAFVVNYGSALSVGRLPSLLPTEDVPLTTCPAPGVLCLLANLAVLGLLCPQINCSDASKLEFNDAAMFFDFLSAVIDCAPLGAFSSRQSAVEWISLGGSHHMPIVLSSVVIDQCKTFVLDSYVRQLFMCAVDDTFLNTDDILGLKNEKDLKHEKDLLDVGATSAASLAAKEAMVDRSKSFWQTSKWARKLSESVTSLLSGDNAKASRNLPPNIPKGAGKLLNTSSVARHMAQSGRGSSAVATALAGQRSDEREVDSKRSPKAFSTAFFFSLCRAYGSVLARWGGGGKEDFIRKSPARNGSGTGASEDVSGDATGTPDPCVLSLLNVLCFATSIVKTTWAIIQSDKLVISDLNSVIDSEKRIAPIRTLQIRPQYPKAASSHVNMLDGTTGAAVLFMFVTCLAHSLIVTDDVEIHEMEKPLPQHQLRRCILLLKKVLYRACSTDIIASEPTCADLKSNYFGLALISAASKTMRDLYDRSSRRPLCVPKLWLVDDLLDKDIRRSKTFQDYSALLSLPVLRVCPFLVSFKRRLKIFERLVTTDRIEIQGSNEQHNLKPGVVVRIMRGRVLEDGLMTLNNLGRDMRRRIVVQYLNQAGATETGVDVGGLFKEFWTDLSNLAFDPNYALFRATEGSGNCLYPNPSSRAAHGRDHIVLFEFMGRILGKALYEGITIQPQFAHFFLSFLRGDYNFLHMLPDLSTMDPLLYNNIMFLKTYDGDAADLCLTFTVANDDFGGNKEVALIPNGANIEVTNSNKHRYIGLVAKHHVCDRVKEQSEAFTRGLWEVIDRSWLQLFNEPELQVLISGASDGKIDLSDMKANTRYTGGYTGLDKHVLRFWKVMCSFSSQNQADLLRFVTSCERPPPLGFASMNPPFTIQRVGIMRDGDKLPTASTCFNTLKLPTYSSEKILKDRLLYAIKAGAGFELT